MRGEEKMNKKIIIFIVIILVVIAGLGIYFMQNRNANNEQVNTNEENTKNEVNKNAAVLYFSATGNTKEVAGYIAEETGATLIEIEPAAAYTDEDLNYSDESSRATSEQNDESARPEIANNIDVSSYDIIYLGYPIWWGDVPKIILTFLDNTDLTGKTVIPFCTSGSSGIETSLNTLKDYQTDINWLDGARLTTSKSEVENWLNSLEY